MPRPLTPQESIILLQILAVEKGNIKISEETMEPINLMVDNLMSTQIIKKRIKAFNLPIDFTNLAYHALTLFTDRPGAVVLLLIDALTKYENKTVTVQDLVDLYPLGFYSEGEFTEIIDKQIKPRKVKWSEIY